MLKLYARLVIRIYCRSIKINQPEVLQSKGPLLLASNHPNSFLDGIILTTLFQQPVYTLARGDAFKNKILNQLLRSIQLLPVYRVSEGVENLEHNYTTFEACRHAFEKKDIVLIFSEGRCENEWHLRPLKKGTARLAITSWKQGIPLQVIPTAFNYSSFKNFGKEVHLSFGTPVEPSTILQQDTDGKQMLTFNEALHQQLHQMVYEIDPADKKTINKLFSIKRKFSFYLLLLPAAIGWVLHAPLFYGCKYFTAKKFNKSGHYDSVMTSLLILLYPLWLVLLCVIGYLLLPLYGWVLLLIMPFTAKAGVEVKYQAGW